MTEKDTTLTPLWLINAIGRFDLDPCAIEDHPTATNRIVWPRDGLAEPWEGAVWCNPPYSAPGPWMRRMGRHGNGVALVLASTETAWFQDMAETAEHYFFLKGRPKFLRIDRTEVGLMRGTILVGWGEAGTWLGDLRIPGFYMPAKHFTPAVRRLNHSQGEEMSNTMDVNRLAR